MLLHYNETNLINDLYFNLYNNIWNTNFPMWYSDDALFRFKIKEKHPEINIEYFECEELYSYTD